MNQRKARALCKRANQITTERSVAGGTLKKVIRYMKGEEVAREENRYQTRYPKNSARAVYQQLKKEG